MDFTNAKRKPGGIYPDSTIDATGAYGRVEPILTPKKLKSRFLFGISLRSPVTDDEIKLADLDDYIMRGIAKVETDAKINVMPTVARERLPFDPNLYQKNMWFEVPKKPISKVIRLAICSASYRDTPQQQDRFPSGNEIYTVPNDWIDMSYATHGKLFVNPLNPAFASIGTATSANIMGATILQFINTGGWIPAFWTIEYLHGICDELGRVPVFVNEVIGMAAAMMVLDNLILMYRVSSQSLGVDGLSQSISDLGYQLLTQKRTTLADEYKIAFRRLKATFGQSYIVSNI